MTCMRTRGTLVAAFAIASPHAGGGRQVHLIDVGAIRDGGDA